MTDTYQAYHCSSIIVIRMHMKLSCRNGEPRSRWSPLCAGWRLACQLDVLPYVIPKPTREAPNSEQPTTLTIPVAFL